KYGSGIGFMGTSPYRRTSIKLMRCAHALILCVALLQARAQSPPSELELGISAFDRADYRQAINHLQHAISINPRATEAHLYLGRVYDEKCASPNPCDPQWSNRAIAEYSAVLDIDPSHGEALKSMAYLLYRISRSDEAEGLYRRAAKLDSRD